MSRLRLPIRSITHYTLSVLTVGACAVDAPNEAPNEASDEEPSTLASASAALAETCAWAPTLAITPSVIPPTRAGVAIPLDVAISNPNPASCAPITVDLRFDDTGLILGPLPPVGVPRPAIVLAGGETTHITGTATIPRSADAGDVHRLNVIALQPLPPPPPPPAPLPPPPVTVVAPPVLFPVAAAPGCQVSAARELMIVDVSVVDDPLRTAFDPASRDPRNGVWTFKHLVEQIARAPGDAPAMVEALLASFNTPRSINGFTVAARPGMQSKVLATWPRTATGALDLARAPLRLQAIVSRIDLRNLAAGDAGEGRFVFAFDLPPEPGAPPPEATIIFEYKLPASSLIELLVWAESFHLLGRIPFGERYNLALQLITERFVRRGARPRAPNGSAISAVRTNEIPLGDNRLWELREFHLSRATGRLEPAALELTPDFSFNNTSALAGYIAANESQILSETHVVPPQLNGQPFQAGAVFNDLTAWRAAGADPEARHLFAINTCNGCHAAEETGTVFLHLVPRQPGQPSERSRWLTGSVLRDPVTSEPRAFDDLARRKDDLKSIVCRDRSALTAEAIGQGIRRVH